MTTHEREQALVTLAAAALTGLLSGRYKTETKAGQGDADVNRVQFYAKVSVKIAKHTLREIENGN